MAEPKFDQTLYEIMLDDLKTIRKCLDLELTDEQIEALAKANAIIMTES